MRQYAHPAVRFAMWPMALALAAACGAPALAENQAEPAPPAPSAPSTVSAFTPGVTIVPEVVTKEGNPRLYPVGGGRETVWQPGMPVFMGDQIRLKTFAATGNAALKEITVRLDNETVRTLTAAPWTAEFDTSSWTPGYHFVEIFVRSDSPEAAMGSSTMVFFAREPLPPMPQTETRMVTEVQGGSTTETRTEPVTAVAGTREDPSAAWRPAHPGTALPMDAAGQPQYDPALRATVHSRDAQAEEILRSAGTVRLTAPTLFSVTAGQRARRFVYALSRQGHEVFRSDALPISALVRLQPKVGETSVGLRPGELSLWVWAGDENGVYGEPVRVLADIAPSSP